MTKKLSYGIIPAMNYEIKKLLDLVDAACKEHGLNRKTFSEAAGIKYDVIRDLERERTKSIKLDNHQKIQKFLSSLEIRGLSDSGKSTYDGIMPARPSDFVSIAIYDATVSCGGGSINEDEAEIIGHHSYRKDWLRKKTSATTEQLFNLRVIGDSMEMFLCEGDTVLIDTTQKTITHGQHYAICVDDGLSLKRIDATDNGYVAMSYNPKYAPMRLDDSMTIFGKVINRSGSV